VKRKLTCLPTYTFPTQNKALRAYLPHLAGSVCGFLLSTHLARLLLPGWTARKFGTLRDNLSRFAKLRNGICDGDTNLTILRFLETSIGNVEITFPMSIVRTPIHSLPLQIETHRALWWLHCRCDWHHN
jgi:hypothetical protein